MSIAAGGGSKPLPKSNKPEDNKDRCYALPMLESPNEFLFAMKDSKVSYSVQRVARHTSFME